MYGTFKLSCWDRNNKTESKLTFENAKNINGTYEEHDQHYSKNYSIKQINFPQPQRQGKKSWNQLYPQRKYGIILDIQKIIDKL